jgi:hypothetical protein
MKNTGHYEEYRITHEFHGLGQRTLLLNARRIVGKAGAPQLILLSMDVSA